jgi:hypothetical protein
MGKSAYGDSRFPTGKATIIVGNAKALEALLAQIEGSSTEKKPEYYVAGTSEVVMKLVEEGANKKQVNSILENYREMIAAQTETPFVPTTVISALSGVKTNQKDGKLSMTTVGARGKQSDPNIPGIVL